MGIRIATYEQAKMLGIGHLHPDSPEERKRCANEVAASEGRWTMEIPGWRPVLANELVGEHPMKIARLKAKDVEVLSRAAVACRVPQAARKRHVRMVILGRYQGNNWPDRDAPLKSGLDALKRAGLIVDDSERWCDWEKPDFRRGPKGTVITLQDL